MPKKFFSFYPENDEFIPLNAINFVKNFDMQFSSPIPIQTIATLIGAKIIGNESAHATGINEIHKVAQGDLVFVDHPKYYDKCIHSAASFIIINKEMDCPEGKALLVVENPFEAYCSIVNKYRPFEPSNKLISDSAQVDASAIIYPNVFIGNHVKIGKDCVIYPNVTIMDHCIIGDHVVIQSGTTIGSNAF